MGDSAPPPRNEKPFCILRETNPQESRVNPLGQYPPSQFSSGPAQQSPPRGYHFVDAPQEELRPHDLLQSAINNHVNPASELQSHLHLRDDDQDSVGRGRGRSRTRGPGFRQYIRQSYGVRSAVDDEAVSARVTEYLAGLQRTQVPSEDLISRHETPEQAREESQQQESSSLPVFGPLTLWQTIEDHAGQIQSRTEELRRRRYDAERERIDQRGDLSARYRPIWEALRGDPRRVRGHAWTWEQSPSRLPPYTDHTAGEHDVTRLLHEVDVKQGDDEEDDIAKRGGEGDSDEDENDDNSMRNTTHGGEDSDDKDDGDNNDDADDDDDHHHHPMGPAADNGHGSGHDQQHDDDSHDHASEDDHQDDQDDHGMGPVNHDHRELNHDHHHNHDRSDSDDRAVTDHDFLRHESVGWSQFPGPNAPDGSRMTTSQYFLHLYDALTSVEVRQTDLSAAEDKERFDMVLVEYRAMLRMFLREFDRPEWSAIEHRRRHGPWDLEYCVMVMGMQDKIKAIQDDYLGRVDSINRYWVQLDNDEDDDELDREGSMDINSVFFDEYGHIVICHEGPSGTMQHVRACSILPSPEPEPYHPHRHHNHHHPPPPLPLPPPSPPIAPLFPLPGYSDGSEMPLPTPLPEPETSRGSATPERQYTFYNDYDDASNDGDAYTDTDAHPDTTNTDTHTVEHVTRQHPLRRLLEPVPSPYSADNYGND
ncbi:hypothetical protein PV08_07041 [Exophiala spinifera]|uniref:Uncharacterized protein n=1 Tax=Exophiala spinifera TaxID=91928 RepID=A0A0D2BSK8_9EURO|nr:uncharacterized protein PV08_07041 [Exophiala spinifera]KIW14259.1 hypothetical protein PV08_07041 [Exophiala spinifera]